MTDDGHVILSVPGISCDHCKKAIEAAVADLEGVDEVVVDVGARSVEVAFDRERVSLTRIEEAIAEEGYEVAWPHGSGA